MWLKRENHSQQEAKHEDKGHRFLLSDVSTRGLTGTAGRFSKYVLRFIKLVILIQKSWEASRPIQRERKPAIERYINELIMRGVGKRPAGAA